MDHSYVIVKYDLFPYFVIHRLECVVDGKYRVEGVGDFVSDSVLGVMGSEQKRNLDGAIRELKRRREVIENDTDNEARFALQRAIEA